MDPEKFLMCCSSMENVGEIRIMRAIKSNNVETKPKGLSNHNSNSNSFDIRYFAYSTVFNFCSFSKSVENILGCSENSIINRFDSPHLHSVLYTIASKNRSVLRTSSISAP